MKTIKVNKAKCLDCGDILESKHRHDYVTCTCGNLAVDGGKDYLKRNFSNYSKVKELSEFEGDLDVHD
jgi:hypothetical protein